ncbi:MAG: hypothetical protein BroJett018_51510 [Chloroflexota bacterium]|nr:MAG: hypothetical protein BroJett018_51510 [Chloroflexota bacterium]
MARLTSINIKGFRPFQDFTAQLGPLEVIVGANGAGKSALFEFLKFLRDSTQHAIPPGIIEGYVGQQIFNRYFNLESIIWTFDVKLETKWKGKGLRV